MTRRPGVLWLAALVLLTGFSHGPKPTVKKKGFEVRWAPGDQVKARLAWTITSGTLQDSVIITIRSVPARGNWRLAYPRSVTRDTSVTLNLSPVPAEGDTTRFFGCFQTKKRGVMSPPCPPTVEATGFVVKPVDPGTVRADTFTVGIVLSPDTLQTIREGGSVHYILALAAGYADGTPSGRTEVQSCDYEPHGVGPLLVIMAGNLEGTVADSVPLRVLGKNEPAGYAMFANTDMGGWGPLGINGPPWPRRPRSPALGESTTYNVPGVWSCQAAGFTESEGTRLSAR